MMLRRAFSVCLVASVLVALPVAWTLSHSSDPAGWQEMLQLLVQDEKRNFDGDVSLFVKDVSDGQRFAHNASVPSYLASGVKILVLIATFDAVHQGKLRWDEKLTFGIQDIRDGVVVLTGFKLGKSFTVEQLVNWMMKKSDNAATDLLIKRIGIDVVNQVAKTYGGPGLGTVTSLLDVRRQIYRRLDKRADGLSAAAIASIRRQGDFDARAKRLARLVGQDVRAYSGKDLWNAYQEYYESGSNSAPLDAVGSLLEKLVRGEVINPEISESILALMAECETGGNRIRAGLPAGVKLIHKTGTQHMRLCDLGIFYLSENEPIVFSICLKNFEDLQKAESLVARFASKTYALLRKKRRPGAPELQLASVPNLPPLVPVADSED